MLQAFAELNKAHDRIKTTRARILEVLNPNTTHFSTLNTRTEEGKTQPKTIQQDRITQERNPIWHYVIQETRVAYLRIKDHSARTGALRRKIQDKFKIFKERRTALRRIRPLGGVAEWSSMHSNTLMDLAMDITKDHGKYLEEKRNLHKAITQYHGLHNDSIAMMLAQIGTLDLAAHSSHEDTSREQRTTIERKHRKSKNKRRKRRSRRYKRQRGPTSKETHILHGNTMSTSWQCACGYDNPAILVRCTNRQCGRNREHQTESDNTQTKDNALWIHERLVSQFLGKGGENIKRLGEKYRVRISIDTKTPKNGHCELSILGPMGRKTNAEEEIQEWITNNSLATSRDTNPFGSAESWVCRECSYKNRTTRAECRYCWADRPVSHPCAQNPAPHIDPWYISKEEEQRLKDMRKRWPQREIGPRLTPGWWTCKYCNRTAKLCEGNPEYCTNCYTPMNQELKGQINRWGLRTLPAPIPADGEIELDPKTEIEQEKRRDQRMKWVPKARDPRPTSECSACWKTVQCTWKNRDGHPILRGPVPPPRRNGDARLCEKCEWVTGRILSLQRVNPTQDQLQKYRLEHIPRTKSIMECHKKAIACKYTEMKKIAVQYIQTQQETQRSNRKAIRAAHLTIINLKQAYEKLTKTHCYEHATILDAHGTQAMDEKEILHLDTPLGNLVVDKYKYIRERNALAVKHEELGRKLRQVRATLSIKAKDHKLPTEELQLEEYREIPNDYRIVSNKTKYRYKNRDLDLDKYIKYQRQNTNRGNSKPPTEERNHDQAVKEWQEWQKRVCAVDDNSSEENGISDAHSSSTSDSSRSTPKARTRKTRRRRRKSSKHNNKPRKVLTNRVNRATKGNIPQSQIKIALWHVLKLHSAPARAACTKENNAMATMSTIATTLLTKSYDLAKGDTALHEVSHIIIATEQTLDQLVGKTKACKVDWSKELRALSITTTGITTNKGGKIYEVETPRFPTTTGRQHGIGEIHPDEYHGHRLCAMPWPKPEAIGHASTQDPAHRDTADYIVAELWHQCASTKATIIQLNRYITKLKIEECRVREIAHNADQLKKLMHIAKGEQERPKGHRSYIDKADDRRKGTQIQTIISIAGKSELWVAGKEQELLVCRHAAEKEREHKRREAGDAAVLLENIFRNKTDSLRLYWDIVYRPQPNDCAKIIHIQAKTRPEMIAILNRDYQINRGNHNIEFRRGKNGNDGSPRKPIIAIITDKHTTPVQWTITPRKWNKFMHATHGNGTKEMCAGAHAKGKDTKIPSGIWAAVSDFHVKRIITKSNEERKLNEGWKTGRSRGYTT